VIIEACCDRREVGTNAYHVVTDLGDAVESAPEDALVFALVQMKAETLERVDEAVRHVDDGTYGYSTMLDGSRQHRSARCLLRCVVGIAKRDVRTSIARPAGDEGWGYTKVSSTPSSDRSLTARLVSCAQGGIA
jgi:hypothetical protein